MFGFGWSKIDYWGFIKAGGGKVDMRAYRKQHLDIYGLMKF